MNPLILLLLAPGCVPDDQSADSFATSAAAAASAASGTSASSSIAEDGTFDPWDGDWSAPMLQVVALDVAFERWARDDVHGTLGLPDGGSVYLFGSVEEVDALLSTGRAAEPLAGVVLSSEGVCLGTVAAISTLEGSPSLRGDSLILGETALDLDDCQLAPAPIEDIRARAGMLSSESTEVISDEGTEAPPPSCSSSCGSNAGYSYAGETAYSNGSNTGSGSSCGGTDTYGNKYQCVQYTERVHHRSDWAGNAYTGYWSNTGLSSGTQGPYYKSLLPLGNGTGYLAPQAGDVIVWNGGKYGHVAVAASVSASTITEYDQNRSCGDQSCTLTYSTSSSVYTLGNGSGTGYCGAESMTYTLSGYLHRGWDFGGTYGLASSSGTASTQHNWYLNDASLYGSTTSGSISDISDYIELNPGTSDPYMVSPPGLGIAAYSGTATYGYRYVSFYIRSNCTNKSAQLFWKRTSDAGFDSTRSVNATITGTGWQTLTFSPSTSANWSGTIDQIRLDPASSCSSASTDTIALQSSWFWR